MGATKLRYVLQNFNPLNVESYKFQTFLGSGLLMFQSLYLTLVKKKTQAEWILWEELKSCFI
jgi:hypothetical protein